MYYDAGALQVILTEKRLTFAISIQKMRNEDGPQIPVVCAKGKATLQCHARNYSLDKVKLKKLHKQVYRRFRLTFSLERWTMKDENGRCFRLNIVPIKRQILANGDGYFVVW